MNNQESNKPATKVELVLNELLKSGRINFAEAAAVQGCLEMVYQKENPRHFVENFGTFGYNGLCSLLGKENKNG